MEKQNNSWNEALNLVIESVLKPDAQFRDAAREDLCYKELLEIRENTVHYLQSLRKWPIQSGFYCSSLLRILSLQIVLLQDYLC